MKFQWWNIIGLFGIFIVSIIIGLISNSDGKPDTSEEYYNKYDIKLKGVVVERNLMDDRHACCKIKIISSNTKSHDLRGNGGQYFLYVNNDTAFLMWAQIFVNDTVNIDYASRRFSITRNGQNMIQGMPGFIMGYRNLVQQAEKYMN